jgi:hypothetical protein
MTDKLSIHQTAIDKAIRILEATGAKYAIHIGDEVYGTLKVMPESNQKRNRPYAHGETRSHYLPYIENLQIGESASIAYSYFDPKVLASNISAFCCHTWGAGSAMTAKNDLTKCVEILRLA